jgi:hypothetical protein
LNIAVIGAGAAGLAATRVLSRSLHKPTITVLEKDDGVGGIWDYRLETNINNNNETKDRPMYRGLRTNLPKEVMQYREYPWQSSSGDGKDASFLTHYKVAEYLRSYETHFDLTKYIQFGATVKQLTMLNDEVSSISTPTNEEQQWPKIQLDWELQSSSRNKHSDQFDAVFICNGHYSQPSSPHIPGLEEYYQGTTMHSISYDNPQDFAGQVVLCIGGRASGSDLARELSFHAQHVYLSDTTCPEATNVVDERRNNDCHPVTWVPKTIAVRPDGSVQFDRDCPLHPSPDCIIFCSGYDYSFPFINDKSSLDLQAVPGERRVKPLYKQLWHAQYPNLAFVGLPHSVVPFPLMEFQCEAAWAQWQHCDKLPDLEERLSEAQIDAESGGAGTQGRVQDTHFLGDQQWDYCREMARFAGHNDHPETATSVEAYISMNKALYDYAGMARKVLPPGGPDTYRSLVFQRDPSQQRFDVADPLAIMTEGIKRQ